MIDVLDVRRFGQHGSRALPDEERRAAWRGPRSLRAESASYTVRDTRDRARAVRGADPRDGSKVKLSSADRVLFPDDGITKGDLFAYYDEVAPAIVPHLRDRPFTMKR